MIEKLAIAAVVLAALAFIARKLYRWLSGRDASCSACGKAACTRRRRESDS